MAPGATVSGRIRIIQDIFYSKQAGYLAILLLCVMGIYFFGLRGMRFFLVPSASMQPTLLRADQIVTLREPRYGRGDIVVFVDYDGAYSVKRIAGIGGDSIKVGGGALFINGEYASEPYIQSPMDYIIMPPVLVPEGRVFLLGDNRNDSDDSHIDGRTYPVSDIIGKVRFIYYPYRRFGAVRSHPLRTVPIGLDSR